MFSQRFFSHRRSAIARAVTRAHRIIADAAVQIVCEHLEARQFLSTYTYTVPTAMPAHTAAYLQLVQGAPGRVQVRLDDPATGPIGYTFTNTTGMDIIQVSSGVSGFTFVDQVPAALKPAADANGDAGIKVAGGSGNTLRIEAGDNDNLIEVTESTSTSSTVAVTEIGESTAEGYTRFTAAVSTLVLRTNDRDAQTFRDFGGDGTNVVVPVLRSGTHLLVDTGSGTYDKIALGRNNSLGEQVTVLTGAGNDVVNIQESSGDDETLALVDFVYAGQLGLGNILNIYSAGTAHLDNAPGTQAHHLYVDEVNVFGGGLEDRGSLIVDHASTIDHLHVNDHGDATLLASTTIDTFLVDGDYGTALIAADATIGTMPVDGTAEFTADATIDNFEFSDGTVNVDAGADLIVANRSYIESLNVVGTGATLVFVNTRDAFGNVTRVQNLTVSYGGLVKLEPVNEPPSESMVSAIIVVNNLDLGSPTGTLDLADGGLILDYGGSSPSSDIRDWLDSGHDGDNSWDGPGINSSRAAEDHADSQISYITGLGHNEASNLPGLTSFGGVQLDSTMVLVRYTYLGDIDLSGAVDITDLGIFATNWQSQGEWPEGDFNYDDFIDITDLGFLATNWQLGKSNPSSQTFNEAWAEVNGW